MVSKHVCGYEQNLTRIYDYGYTYDKRGNLVKEEEVCSPTTTGPRNITIATYLYDETEHPVRTAINVIKGVYNIGKRS